MLTKLIFRQRIAFPLLLLASNLSHATDATPENLSQFSVPDSLISTIDQALPERSQVNAAFLNPEYNPNLTFSENARVGVTFVDEGAGYRNSLGFFNFEQGALDNLSFADIDTDNSGIISVQELSAVESFNAGVLFGNFSEVGGGGSLRSGDTAVIGGGSAEFTNGEMIATGGTVFEAGTTTGFFLVANGWNGSGVKGLDSPGDPNTFYTLDFLNPENNAGATLDSADEQSRHVAMMFASDSSQAVIVGFEDLVRPGGDNDFNDAVFIIHSDPFSAISSNALPLAAAPAPIVGNGLLVVILILGMVYRIRRSTPRQSGAQPLLV